MKHDVSSFKKRRVSGQYGEKPDVNYLTTKNGANGIRDIEGKAARVAASEVGAEASFNTKHTK
jgi:hypothetical protein